VIEEAVVFGVVVLLLLPLLYQHMNLPAPAKIGNLLAFLLLL
jgi:hypothetical protein